MFRTHLRRGIISRVFFTCCGVLALGLAFISTPTAHAAPLKSHAATLHASCGVFQTPYAPVVDSYGNLQGYLLLLTQNSDCSFPAAWGLFKGNYNTWRQITVYVEYAYKYGYLDTSYSYNSDIYAESPDYKDYNNSTCYYAEINLIDNRGYSNWFNTENQDLNGNPC